MTTAVLTEKHAKPLLGLYVIVKNGEETLPRLLDSIDPDSFDEIVFVDTGSTDRTRAILLRFFFGVAHDPAEPEVDNEGFRVLNKKSWNWEVGPNGFRKVIDEVVQGQRIVFANFDWINDFSAARNYAFGLGTATWRMWLDADDELPNADAVKPFLKRIKPEINCVVMPYEYEPTFIQDKYRIVRWEDGWRWEGEIHETLTAFRGPKVIHKVGDPSVKQTKSDALVLRSLTRNIEIVSGIQKKAIESGDALKTALMEYYLGLYDYSAYYLVTGAEKSATLDQAVQRLFNAGVGLKSSNLAAYAFTKAAMIVFDLKGDHEEAIRICGMGMSAAPEVPEPYLMAGVVHESQGQFARAARLFDQALAVKPELVMRDQRDLEFESRGKLSAVRSYCECGRIGDAIKTISSIDQNVRQCNVTDWNKTYSKLMKKKGLEVVKNFIDYLVWDTEAPKALEVLDRLVPAAVADMPEIGLIRRNLQSKLPHLASWEGYKKAYDEIPSETYHTASHLRDQILKFGRAKAAVKWAEDHAGEHEGDYPDGGYTVCSIGFQDGLIEQAMLEANPAIKLVVCDVAEQASQGFTELSDKFPGRVERHFVKETHYDWPRDQFDLVIFFEVLEHCPDPKTALSVIATMLKPEGRLLLSTPVADRWVETYLTENPPPFYGHLHAFNPTVLNNLLYASGFHVEDLRATDHTAVFLATCRVDRGDKLQTKALSIFVHGTPLPFDPETHHTKHLGGSEEAVVHLAPELAKLGYRVTVYAPRAVRGDDQIVHAHKDVLWRDNSDFDLYDDSHENVIFWRCPSYLLDKGVQKATYKKFLWLHDTHYGNTTGQLDEAYRAADAVICLSQFHVRALNAGDGYGVREVHEQSNGNGSTMLWHKNVRLATNGVDLASIEPLREWTRIPRSVIYASSPDRGLKNLLTIWPQVKAAVPEARLNVFYSWDMFKKARPQEAAELTVLAESLKDQGVIVHGGVSHKDLHEAFRLHEVWAYPTDFSEISCITAMKAQILGCQPLVADTGALRETLDGLGVVNGIGGNTAIPAGSQEGMAIFASVLIELLKSPTSYGSRRAMSDRARARFGWDKVANGFSQIIDEANLHDGTH